jgi:hypothetical protein
MAHDTSCRNLLKENVIYCGVGLRLVHPLIAMAGPHATAMALNLTYVEFLAAISREKHWIFQSCFPQVTWSVRIHTISCTRLGSIVMKSEIIARSCAP